MVYANGKGYRSCSISLLREWHENAGFPGLQICEDLEEEMGRARQTDVKLITGNNGHCKYISELNSNRLVPYITILYLLQRSLMKILKYLFRFMGWKF